MTELLNIEEAARFLHISTSFLYRETAGGRIRHYKLGAACRFDETQLMEWLAGREVKTVGALSKSLALVS